MKRANEEFDMDAENAALKKERADALAALEKTRKELDSVEIPFCSRGIGMENVPCFVCGYTNGCLHNISGFVQTQHEGEFVVRRFGGHGRARLDFRPDEPNWIQVKIGACDEHLENLKALNGLVNADKTISGKMVQKARRAEATALIGAGKKRAENHA